jgi:hypothetical protein
MYMHAPPQIHTDFMRRGSLEQEDAMEMTPQGYYNN